MDKRSELYILPNKHSVFISYSWDSNEHKRWVRELARKLENEGIQVVIDMEDFHLGDMLPQMMEEAITKCEYVLFVCTPKYKEKSDKRLGGVTYEDTIITGEIFEKQNHRKYIPVFRNNNLSESTPNWAKGKLGIILSDDDTYKESFQRLVDEIYSSNLDIMDSDDETKEIGFYAFSPTTQIALLKSLCSIIDTKDGYDYTTVLDDLYFTTLKLDPKRLEKDVRSVLLDTIKELEKKFADTVLEDIQENP